MVRIGRIVDDLLALLGIALLISLGACGVVLILATQAACAVLRNWWAVFLGALVAVLLLSGCTTGANESPRDARDPQIWRPSASQAAYPLPR